MNKFFSPLSVVIVGLLLFWIASGLGFGAASAAPLCQTITKEANEVEIEAANTSYEFYSDPVDIAAAKEWFSQTGMMKGTLDAWSSFHIVKIPNQPAFYVGFYDEAGCAVGAMQLSMESALGLLIAIEGDPA